MLKKRGTNETDVEGEWFFFKINNSTRKDVKFPPNQKKGVRCFVFYFVQLVKKNALAHQRSLPFKSANNTHRCERTGCRGGGEGGGGEG